MAQFINHIETNVLPLMPNLVQATLKYVFTGLGPRFNPTKVLFLVIATISSELEQGHFKICTSLPEKKTFFK